MKAIILAGGPGQELARKPLRDRITDILRAIHDKTVLQSSPDYIMRDYLYLTYFSNLIRTLLSSLTANVSFDYYGLAPIDKPSQLTGHAGEFGLRYQVEGNSAGVMQRVASCIIIR